MQLSLSYICDSWPAIQSTYQRLESHCDMGLHMDFMDGSFVPRLGCHPEAIDEARKHFAKSNPPDICRRRHFDKANIYILFSSMIMQSYIPRTKRWELMRLRTYFFKL